MNYNLKGTGLELTQEIRDYLNKKLAHHVEKVVHDGAPMQLDIELEFSAAAYGGHYRAEFTAVQGKDQYRAEARAESLHEAIDRTCDEFFKELSRAKGKRVRLVRRGAARLKDFLRGLTDRA